jgi:DNA repair protein REV1
MDAFFCSVYLRDHPELRDQPVVVTHASGSSAQSGEISTCNYKAREFGVRSGMWMRRAKELCPNLVTVPYMFEQYTEVSTQLYR